MNDDVNVVHNIMHLSYYEITKKMYLQEQNMYLKNADFAATKILFWVYY